MSDGVSALSDSHNSCVMCGRDVSDDVVHELSLYSIPPICSVGCAGVGAEMMGVEMRANLREYMGLATVPFTAHCSVCGFSTEWPYPLYKCAHHG